MTTSVLICDDSMLARKQVMRSLPDYWNVEIQQATNGLEALEVLRNNKIQVMFLDLTMPELDGLGVLENILKEDIEVSAFVISADIQPEMQTRVLELGARAFMRKPINPATLVDTLKQNGLL